MKTKNNKSNGILSMLLVFAIVLVCFYGLDHFIMNSQGLPLNLDLTPAN